MRNTDIRKLYVAAFDDLITRCGYSRRRKADLYEKRSGGWRLTVDLRPSITYGRVKTDLVFRGTLEAFEDRLAAVIGDELHGRLGSRTFLEDGGSLIPENTLLALYNGADDIPELIDLIARAIGEMEDFAERSSRDTSLLCDSGAVNLVRRGFACWEIGDIARAARHLEQTIANGPPEVREASAILLARLEAE